MPWSEPWTSRVPLWLEDAAVVEVPPLVNCKTRAQLIGGTKKIISHLLLYVQCLVQHEDLGPSTAEQQGRGEGDKDRHQPR